MEPSALHRQIDLFEAGNNSLYFALGLVSMARNLSAAMDPAGSAPRALFDAPETDAGDEPDKSSADSALFFALGLVALSQRLERILEAETRTWHQRRARARRAPGAAPDSPAIRSRDLLL
ncbi:MAG: hypothetical protein M5R40_17145 [Anaerolineae bacterium]|nr:hypothetical protein [Anaerolineae bacterium]